MSNHDILLKRLNVILTGEPDGDKDKLAAIGLSEGRIPFTYHHDF